MSWIYLICGLLMSALTVKPDHFRGGTISWKPIDNVPTGSYLSIVITQTYTWTLSRIGCNTSIIQNHSVLIDIGTRAGAGVNLTCIDNCSTSGGYIGNEVPITGYCTDFSNALDLTVSQRSDIVNLTIDSYFIVTFATSGGWQILTLGNSTGWSLSCLVNLHIRSDNGLINNPPVGISMSYISIPQGLIQTIEIPVFDLDNDRIRCRFANGSSECANACPPGSLPLGTSLTSSCILTITGNAVGDYYLVAIQIEDYMTNSSITPLSTIPLQFLIYVYAVPSCSLKPLLRSNINNGNCVGVQVGVSLTMTLTAINQCGSGRIMNDIATISFPILIKSALVQNPMNISLWSINITWKPTATQLGSQVFCAVAADNGSVQSDQYCVKFYVGVTTVPLCPGGIQNITNQSTLVATMSTAIGISPIESTSTMESLKNLPLGLGLGLGLGLPLLALIGIMAICLCCRWCSGSFWKNLRQRFWKEKNDICSLCRRQYDDISPMNNTRTHHYISEQHRRQYTNNNPLVSTRLMRGNDSIPSLSLSPLFLNGMTTTPTTLMSSSSNSIMPIKDIPMEIRSSGQSVYMNNDTSILLRAYVKQERIRNISHP